jgi:tetratricopeptide (TPR) repeat protein
MLELDAQDTGALNLLAQAMRFQNRNKESREVIRQILARVPEDAFGQTNAGFEALNSGDHERAHGHFVNALRINPHSDNARRGLLQAMRARMWFYRVNLKLLDFFGAIKRKPIVLRLIFILLFVASGGVFIFVWLFYLLLSFTLQPLSNLFLLLDPVGRRALLPLERNRAILVLSAIVTLFVLLALSKLFLIDLVLTGYVGLFALGVYVPRWIAARKNRREENPDAPASGSSA